MDRKETVKTSDKSAMNSAIQSIGQVFVTRYYKAIQGKPGAWAMDRFYDEKSRHVQLQAGGGRPDEAFGLDRIKRSVARMGFDRYAFAVDSVFTIQTRPTRYTVVAVGRLTRAGRAGSRNFVHSTVMVKMPSTKRRYSILRTVMKFADRVVDDDESFRTVTGAVTKEPTATDVPRKSAGRKATTVKRTATAENIPSGSIGKPSAPTIKTVAKHRPTVTGVAIREKKIQPVAAPIKDESIPSLIELNQLNSFEDNNNNHTRKMIKEVNESLIKILLDEKNVSNGDSCKILPAKQDGRLKDLGYVTNRKSEPRPAVQKPMPNRCPAIGQKNRRTVRKNPPH